MLSPTRPIDRSGLHPGTGYLIAPQVPHGLAAVVEGLTREVLRHRPEDIYVFAARHFEKLLKLREEYHAEEYNDRAFSHEFSYDFNLWPTKETKHIRKLSNGGWSLEREIEILEKRGRLSADVEESPEDVSTDRESRKAKQTSSRNLATTKKTLKKSKDNETTSDARATRIISQMTGLHGPGKNIQTKDIKQELRKNKLSGEKSKATDSIEKGIRGDRRSRTRVSKTDKGSEEKIERTTTTTTTTTTTATTTTTTTTSSSRTSARRSLKKVRRIETESETETEREIAVNGFENRHTRASIKNDSTSRETIAQTGNKKRRQEAQFSEHSSERKVSSRALSMDRIRAYVLRKFASTASLEVLRSPTYVEQVQEVIDRAAPIIKKKLEEIGKPRGKRSRSIDLAWNEESLRRHVRDERRRGEEEESEREKGENRLERKEKKEEMEGTLKREETIPECVEREKKKSRRRSVGSGKRSRRRESGDFGVVDQVDDNSKHSDKLEHESVAARDTLEARLTATQNILEGISKSTSELGGGRKSDSAGSESSELEISDHVNIVSLPVVRPPSSRSTRSAVKNGSDNLTLPPISPEAPKSTKKKDELSLPILSAAATNGNHSAKKQQEDISRDAEEASTMHDITSDIEDIAVLPENGHEDVIADIEQNPNDEQYLTSDVRLIEEHGKDEDKVFREDISVKLDKKRRSLEEFEELEQLEEGRRLEVFRDSLNVTPEMLDVPLRPDSLEPDEDESKLQNGNADLARENTVDRLKDKLIEIEMAERNIEKALACQQVVMCDTGEMTSQVEKSMTDGKINEAGERTNEAEETMNETEKSTGAGKISVNKDDEEKNNEEKRKSNDVEEIKDIEENKTENLNIEKKLTNKTEQVEREILKNEVKTASDQTETMTKAIENVIKSEDERSTDKIEKSTNGKLPNGIEELAVEVQVENLQSINSRSHDKVSQVTETVVSETDGATNKESKSKAEDAANGESTSSGNVTMLNSEISITNLPKENAKTKARKKRDIDKLPVTTPLSLEVPFSYVLSEGSPCEIPDSVTTVIIPDRPCPSPVILEEENLFDTTKNRRDESITRFDMAKETSNDERQEENQHECGMEAFGEYIRPDATGLSIDTDFMRNVKELKLNQDIIHQNLDGIKEEGEEEEEKEDNEKTKVEDYQEKKDNKEAEEEMKTHATLEDIVEESEETNIKAVESKEISEEISSSRILENESMPNNKDLIVSSDVTDEGKTDVVVDLRNTLENSSEESGSTQETHTTTSSDLKESTASNESIESPSLSRPVVPELNLDSLQDNTVSSFKMTANETEKEDNSSLRESDATTSLIEPLTSDERLMNQLILADHEEEVVAEKLTERDLQSEVPEADQLYQAEHAEYKLLEKDPLSTEINLEDEAKSQGDNIDLKALSENIVQADLEKTEGEELGSEEEIAKELISLLDKDMKLRAEESDLQKESKDSEVSERSNLGIDGKSNQPFSASIHSTSAEQEEKKHENFLSEIDEVTRTEMISKLSDDDSDIGQDNNKNKDMTIDRETEEIQSEMPKEEFTKSLQVAPLAQFEQDELLDENSKVEIIDERITVKRELNANDINIQEKFDDKQISFENANESQSSEHKIEEVNQKWIENEQEEKSPSQEKREQEKLEIHEECKQEKLDVQEEKLKIQEKDDRGNIRVEEEIVETRTLPLEVTESEKDLMKEKDSMKNDNGHEEIRSNTHNESITDDQTEKDMKNEEKEKIEDLSMKIESVHGPITNAISEQSTEDHPSFKNWTVGTKSSTVETVIEAFGSDTSADEKMEVAADAPEIIADESLIREKDDFYSAVVKIQACIRGFLARRRMRQTLNSKLVLDDTSSTQKITTSDRLVVPQDTSNLREARRLRREEALKNTTLSLENAFATGRLQHTGEFHDSVPLPLFDLTTTNKTNSITPNECSSEEIEKDVKDVDQPDIAKSNVDQNESTRNDEHEASFHKNNTFIDPTIPIMMHLLADASRHFTVRQNSHSDFNANTEGAKSVEPTVDILMLGYPRNDENQYLNFITSVEDLGSNMDSLTMNNMMKSTKNTDDAHPSTISGEGSLREPLALPGISQGVVIEEVTSLDDFPSESTKLSTVPKTSLDTNSSMQSEECAVEDAKNNLGMPLRTTDAVEDVKQTDQEAEEQKSDLGNIGENNLLNEDTNEKSNEICCDSGEHVEKEKNDKI